jgi:glycosyltransferase involved in cell wall biosynthesis
MNGTPRVVYATPYDASDVKSWSGTGYFIAEAMRRQGAEIINLWPRNDVVGMLDRIKYYFYTRIVGSNHDVFLSRRVFQRQARQVRAQLQDGVDAIVSTGVSPVAYLRTQLPIITWADATFRSIRDYYPGFENMSSSSLRAAENAERWIAQRADALVFSSTWAAESAVRDYRADPTKVKVISYGANLPAQLTDHEADQLVDSRPRDRCRLLFVGTEWERKGGSIAVETVALLEQLGINTELVILGCIPSNTMPPNVKVLGFVSKEASEGRTAIETLFRDSHFLILPTRADCTPIVIGEAASFAVPVISTDTGGVPSLVRSGSTGLLFPLTAGPQQYAEGIAAIMRDWEIYRRMARAALDEYQSRLNWGTAGRLMMEVIKEAIARRREAKA